METTPVIERELYLIRHGQSLGNIGAVAAEAPLQAREDPPLSPLGEWQAAQLGRFYAETRFDCVYSSALQRAVMTADGLLAGQEETPILLEPLLTEIGIDPAYPGFSAEALRARCPRARPAAGVDPAQPLLQSNAFHDEAAAFARARALLTRIMAEFCAGEKVALVSHAGFLTFILFDLIGYRDHQPFDFKLDNTGVTHVIFYQHGTYPYGDMVFQCVNDRRHLVGTE